MAIEQVDAHDYVQPTLVLLDEDARIVGWQGAIKRLIDLVGASFTIVLMAPVLAVAALAIKIESRGPVFFRQTRVGRNGAQFRLWKLRTMTCDAEQLLPSLLIDNEAPPPLFKMRRDPRVTRVGRVLRRLSIDEIPQVWNVIRGDMSLVGPRPALPAEVEYWPADSYTRLRVRPGITGLWQVHYAEARSFEDYVRFDSEYVEKWSLGLDVRIVLRTVPSVLSPRRIS